MANGQGDGNQSSVINPSEIGRRAFLTAVSTIAVVAPASWAVAHPKEDMYGEFGKLLAAPGKREEVIANILEAIKDMPGCLSYVVAEGANDANGIWIFEAWDSKASTTHHYRSRPSKPPSRRISRYRWLRRGHRHRTSWRAWTQPAEAHVNC